MLGTNRYNVLPARFLFEEANFQWSHKDSSTVPWVNFEAGGVSECPYHDQHAGTYDANYHMDLCVRCEDLGVRVRACVLACGVTAARNERS